MIGRIPAAAAVSRTLFRGYPNMTSTPSRRRISATAVATVPLGDSSLVRRPSRGELKCRLLEDGSDAFAGWAAEMVSPVRRIYRIMASPNVAALPARGDG